MDIPYEGVIFLYKPGFTPAIINTEAEAMQDLRELQERIALIKDEITGGIESLANSKAVYDFKKNFLDPKAGKISELMKSMKDIPAESKAEFGKSVNELKNWALGRFEEIDEQLKAKEAKLRYESEKIDVTMPAKHIMTGYLHPVTQVKNQLIDIFASMGFSVYEGTETETDYYNFTALNTPNDHPARDMQDTFYLSPGFLLRTQTSAGQIHVMEHQQPPIKILSPGKVFRADDDATHSPMFTQMEGLVVDKGITLCDLKGMLEVLCKRMFGENATTRLRPSYFPFTEPSVEVDVSCFECGGKGCRLCKGTGWIEILGAGIVNRKVLENCNIDPDVYSGLAFGIGVERLTMLKYGINNIKMLYESDLRVLEQIND
jgi:phenylalanyl-tRNA synthetase alpha chain